MARIIYFRIDPSGDRGIRIQQGIARYMRLMGDWRPEMYGRFGRFTVEVLESEEDVAMLDGQKEEPVPA